MELESSGGSPGPLHERTRVLLALLGLVVGVALLLGPDIQREIAKAWPPPPAPAGDHAPLVLPEVTVDVSFKGLAKLRFVRQRALDRGLLVRTEDDWVKARLTGFGQSVDARVRLKGDAPDHFEHPDRWSLRVKVRGGKTLDAQRVFSLQRPITRRGVWQPIFYEAMRREGVLAPRYRFVQLRLNDRDLGPYAWEEHFDKHLLESQQRREGPIVRISETGFWGEWANLKDRGYDRPQVPVAVLPDGARQTNAVSSSYADPERETDPHKRRLLQQAVAALDGFRRGQVPASEVINVEKMARYLALIDVFGAEHAARWGNLPFYRDPVTGRLEPIAYDAFGGDLSYHHNPTFSRCPFPCPRDEDGDLGSLFHLLGDRRFVRAYVAASQRISSEPYLQQLIGHIQAWAPTAHAISANDLDVLIERVTENARIIRAHLAVAVPAVGFWDGPDRVSVLNVSWREMWAVGIERQGCRLDLPQPVSVVGPAEGAAPERVVLEGFRAGPCAGDRASPPQLLYRFDGDQTLRGLPLQNRPYQMPLDDVAPLLTRAWPEGMVADEGRILIPAASVVVIDRPVVLPVGLALVVEAGARIDIVKGGQLIVRGPVTMVGSADRRVQVFSSDGAGGGVTVVNEGTSTLAYVDFADLGRFDALGLAVTGAVTFVDGRVNIDEVSVRKARAEDALNLVRTGFDIEALRIEDAQSDALDIDFAAGEIRAAAFERCGNDCIDVSGARVDISGVTMQGAGDKALSAGEAAEVTVSKMIAIGVRVGFAAKDLAQITARDCGVRDAAVGAAAYQKKPEFGPGRLLFMGLRLEDVDQPLWREENAHVQRDGVIATIAVPDGVADRIATVERAPKGVKP